MQVHPEQADGGGRHPPGPAAPRRVPLQWRNGSVLMTGRELAPRTAAPGTAGASRRAPRAAGPHGGRPYAYALARMSLAMTAIVNSALAFVPGARRRFSAPQARHCPHGRPDAEPPVLRALAHDRHRGMTGRSRAIRGQLHVSAETACENLHKALPRKRHEYGGLGSMTTRADARSAADADIHLVGANA